MLDEKVKRKSKKEEVERDQYGHRVHAEKPTSNGHYMGKHCGFDYQDGRYRVAPSHYRLMDESNELENGIRAMMDAQNAYIGRQFERITAMRSQFWNGIKEDYELPRNLQYHGDGWVSITPEEEQKFTCISCGLNGFTTANIFDHQRECKDHPLGKEIRELRAKKGSL